MTSRFTSVRICGRAFSMARDYASMADWELDTIVNPGSPLAWSYTPPAEAMQERARRAHAKTIANEWLVLERNGFGM